MDTGNIRGNTYEVYDYLTVAGGSEVFLVSQGKHSSRSIVRMRSGDDIYLWHLMQIQSSSAEFPMFHLICPVVKKVQSCLHKAQKQGQCPDVLCHSKDESIVQLSPIHVLSPSS